MPHHPIQILLPLSDNQGHGFSGSDYTCVRSELTKQFGGLTAFTRSPAEGLWAHVRPGEFTPKAGNLNHLTGWRLPMCMRD